MSSRRISLIILLGILVAGALVLTVVMVSERDTTLQFTVQDAVSGGWVWNAKATVENREMVVYFQTDHGDRAQTFTRLSPGHAVLAVSAPAYQPRSVQVTLRRGANVLEEPVKLHGSDIPDLSRWVVFERWAGAQLLQELRPIASDGRALINHPCMDIRIGARVSVQMVANRPATEPVEQGSVRGRELFRGSLPWKWDPRPETTFRYGSVLHADQVEQNTAPFWVIDYVILVPESQLTDSAQLDPVMTKSMRLTVDEAAAYIDAQAQHVGFSSFYYTSWNVPGAAR